MRDTRQARIEAGADALEEKYDDLVLDGGPSSEYFRVMAEACLDAADAVAAPDVDPDMTIAFDAPVVGATAAAPAVGVTVDEAETKMLRQKVAALELMVEGLRGLNACYRIGTQRGADKALQRIHKAQDALDALLTAQPGMHDDGETTV